MRGSDTFTESLFTLRKLEDFVPADHCLRPIHEMANAALVQMDALFSGMCAADVTDGRPGIAPEKLLHAMPLQVFYSSAPNASSWSRPNTTSCSAGSSACPWTGR